MTATFKSSRRIAAGALAVRRPGTALDRGLQRYVSKPISYQSFLATIASELTPA